MAATAPGAPAAGAAAAPAAGAAAAPAPQDEVFKVISAQIKRLIQLIQNKLGNNQNVRNTTVRQIVNTLNQIQQNIIDANIVNIRNPNAVHITQDPHSRLYTINRAGNFRDQRNPDYQDYQDGTNNIGTFVEQADYNLAGNLFHQRQSINIDNIDDAAAQTLPTVNDRDLDLSQPANVATLNTRLRNCQYLEILYLVKHEELMKTFAFTLNLYEKYQYAIKLLLFILKNLLDHQCAAPPGGVPPVAAQTIKLPKVLIRNIKDLLKDQQQVQSIIEHMSGTLNSQELQNIQNQLNPTPDNLQNENPGGLNDPHNPH